METKRTQWITRFTVCSTGGGCVDRHAEEVLDVVVVVAVNDDDDAHSDDDAEVGHRSQSHAGQGGVLQHLNSELVADLLPPSGRCHKLFSFPPDPSDGDTEEAGDDAGRSLLRSW